MSQAIKKRESLRRIKELRFWLAVAIRHSNREGFDDINVVAEKILIPIIDEIFDYQYLINLDLDQGRFPGAAFGRVYEERGDHGHLNRQQRKDQPYVK